MSKANSSPCKCFSSQNGSGKNKPKNEVMGEQLKSDGYLVLFRGDRLKNIVGGVFCLAFESMGLYAEKLCLTKEESGGGVSSPRELRGFHADNF